MKILFVAKSRSDKAWSSAIDLLISVISKYSYIDVLYIKDIDIKHISLVDYDYIFINHSISFYLFLLKFKFFDFNKIVYIAHEGEPFLGWFFALKNKQLRKLGSWLRFSKLYNMLPYYLSRDTICLSGLQQAIYKKSSIVKLLGVNDNIFKYNYSSIKNIDIFFPSKITSPEKNFHAIKFLEYKYNLQYPNNTPNNMMPELYNRAKLVIIPSVFETYGLVLVEAMMTNSLILVNSNVGILHELLIKYPESVLNDYGIYINDFKCQIEISKIVDELLNYNLDNVKTRRLALEFGLSYQDASIEFINYVQEKNKR
ncbi:TPA: glycosyltransferase [Photobacterium damselae]